MLLSQTSLIFWYMINYTQNYDNHKCEHVLYHIEIMRTFLGIKYKDLLGETATVCVTHANLVINHTRCYVLCSCGFQMPESVHLGRFDIDQLGLTIQCYSLFQLRLQIGFQCYFRGEHCQLF